MNLSELLLWPSLMEIEVPAVHLVGGASLL